MLLNSEGVTPFTILNILINEERDVNPELYATAVILYSGMAKSFSAL